MRNRRGSTGQEDTERVNRADWHRERPFGRGDRDKQGNDAERRSGRIGIGRGRHESGSWRTPPASASLDPDWEMPLRSALHDKDRRANKDSRVEEPEWLDEPMSTNESAPKVETKPKTAEDFQRWKDQMKGIKTETEKKPEESNNRPTSAKDSNDTSKPAAPLAMDEGLGKLTGWSSTKTVEAKSEGFKPVTGQPKASRFKNFFVPKEQSLQLQGETQSDITSKTATNGKDADKEGFDLILKKLAAQNIQGSSGPEEVGAQPNPLGALFGNNTNGREQPNNTQMHHEDQQDRRMSGFGSWSPTTQRQASSQISTQKAEPVSRTPQNENLFQDLNTLTAPRNQQAEQQPDAKRDLLLSLMKNHPFATSQQQPPPPSHQPPDDPDFQIFLNNDPPQQPAPRSSRGPPSGFFDERFANDFDRQQQQQHQPQQRPMDYEQEMLRRRSSQPQPGPHLFFDDPAISNFQRRSQMLEPEQRFQGNPTGLGQTLPMFDGPFQGGGPTGPPQQHLQQQHASQIPPPQQRQEVGPPPGFNLSPFRNPQQQPPPPSTAFPPGFNPNQASFNMNRNLPPMDGHPGLNRQMSLPPGGGGPNGPPPHMFPGGLPPGAPPGFFNNGPPSAPPPGFHGFPGGPQGFSPDGVPLGRGAGMQGGVGVGQQTNGRGQAFNMDGRMFR